MKKKILIINSGDLPLPPIQGGAVEKLIDDFCTNDFCLENYDITTYSIYDKNLENIDSRYNNKSIKKSRFFSFFYKIYYHFINKITGEFVNNEFINKVKNEIVKDNIKYDYLIVENAPEYIKVIPKKYYKTSILHLHNDYLNVDKSESKKLINSYDYIFCVSNYIKNRVLQVDQNYKNLKVLYNGVNLEKSEKQFDIKNKYNINQDDIVIVYSGRIVPEKGIYDVIDVFSKNKFDKLSLLIIGPHKKSYLYNNKIIYTGYVKHDDLMNIYSQCDYGIVPSKCNEAFGVSAIEFLKMNLPIIYTDDGALTEIVDKNCGILINKNNLYNELNDILTKINKNEIKRENFNDRILNTYTNKFTKKMYCDTFLKYLEEINDEEK